MQNRRHLGLRNGFRAAMLASVVLPLAAPSAVAQTAVSPTSDESGAGLDDIVIIGSHIRGVGDSGALPVTVVTREELDVFGSDSMGDLMANIPSVGDFQFQDNNTGTNGARGDVAGINLRGLGSGHTLVLLNGRRMTAHPASEAVSSVPVSFFNVNVIPAPMVNRVEVLRDGASALYGADAIAGVVNYSLFGDMDGGYLTGRYGFAASHGLEEWSLGGRVGRDFNDGRTNLTVGASYYARNDVLFTELPDFYSTLNRMALVPEPFTGSTAWDNTSTIGPYARLTTGGLRPDGVFQRVRVRQNGTSLTNASGLFHIQPSNLPGFAPPIGALPGGLAIDDGALDRELRYDFITEEVAIPEVERYSVAAMFRHQLASGVELFGEGLYYGSSLHTARAAGPTDASLAYIIVPKENHHNPFGPVGSPNRLPGIDAPVEGLDVLIEGYRPIEHGPRRIAVEQTAFRVVGGLRGDFRDWSWESAFGYSEATSHDEEFNRISKSKLQTQMALTTPDAFNVFGGPGANSQAVLDAIRISGVRETDSSLATWDFRASNSDLFRMPGGPVGAAWGVEWRRETVFDNSDPRLDGTIKFTNGAVPDDSDVVGVSATNDFGGARNVWSAYGELAFPIVGPDNRLPLVHALDLHVAGRFEDSSDFGGVFKPKVAAHWFLAESLSVRAAYAEGFRAPNLVQLNQGTITRRNQGNPDPLRVGVTDTANDLGETYRPSLRSGNLDLEPEESESVSIGVIFEPKDGVLRGLRASVDVWEISTVNAIENFGVDAALNLDAALRASGSSNPNVIRAPITVVDQALFDAYNAANPGAPRLPVGEVTLVLDGYINLSGREVAGRDYSIRYRTPWFAFGTLNFGVDATQITTFDEIREANPSDQIGRNGKPEWRVTSTVGWSHGGWSASASLRWVSEAYDTSATSPATGEYWTVDDWTTVNILVGYDVENGPLAGTSFRVGARNLFNKMPPYADESAGYFSGMHNIEGRVVYGQISRRF